MPFLLELVPALGLGLLLGKCWPGLPARLASPLVTWGVPFSVMGLLLRAGVQWRYGQVALLALAVVTLGLLLVRSWFTSPAEQLAAVVGNTAYFGIPAALALLPAQAVGYAVSYDLAATLFTWSLGPLLLAGEPLRLQPLARALLVSPATRGLLGAVLLQLTPWRELFATWMWWPARLVVLLSLLLVGMRLARRTGAGLQPHLWAVVACKLAALPMALFGLCLLVVGTPLALPPLAVAAVVLQAAAPTAVSVLLLAEAHPCETPTPAQSAAGLVLWSTVLALVSVPLWAWLLTQAGLNPGPGGV